MATFISVGVRAMAHDAWPPHKGLLPRHPLADGHDGFTVRQLLGTAPGREVRFDARSRWFGFGLSHWEFPIREGQAWWRRRRLTFDVRGVRRRTLHTAPSACSEKVQGSCPSLDG